MTFLTVSNLVVRFPIFGIVPMPRVQCIRERIANDALRHQRGRKKACGAVEQKKGAETRKQERKRLRLWRRLENEETASRHEQRNCTDQGESDDIVPFSCRGLREDETRWRTGLPGACEPW
jgi:hypothetical protein